MSINRANIRPCGGKCRFSFIIPAHNSEKSIIRCLDSVVNDVTGSSLEAEILVVENGSNDNTVLLVREYMKDKPAMIKLLVSEKGVSRARNKGISCARGRKIIFVDSDDLWLPGSLKQIADDENCNSADLSVYSYWKDNTLVRHITSASVLGTEADVAGCRAWMIAEPTKRMQVWSKVFDAEIIQKNGVLFNEDLSYSEDGDFMIRYSRCCKSIRLSDRPVYCYMCDTASVMRSVNAGRVKGYILAMETSRRDMADEEAQIRMAFMKYVMIHFNVICVRNVFHAGRRETFKNRMAELKELLELDLFKEALGNLSFRECCTKNLLPELCFKMSLTTFGGILCYVKACINLRGEKQITAHTGGRAGMQGGGIHR